MKRVLSTISIAACCVIGFVNGSCSDSTADGNLQRDTTDYTLLVNPMIGTDFTGNTYPGAQAPFGMVQLSPDNGLPGWDRISGYFYPDSTIAGFSHTHLSGTGAGDLYDISFMPVMIPYNEAEAPLGIHSKFSHDQEEAYAGYYRVKLSDYDIDVELTATERVGVQRYTFPGGDAAVFLNLKKAMNWDATIDTEIRVVDSCTVEGYRYSAGWARDQRVFFRSRFSRPWDSVVIDSTAIDGASGDEQGMLARFNFNTTPNEQITISTAISGVSTDGAAVNLLSEAPTDDFDKALENTKNSWNKELGKFNVLCDNKDRLVAFYTALYHSMIAPTIYSDVDGGLAALNGAGFLIGHEPERQRALLIAEALQRIHCHQRGNNAALALERSRAVHSVTLAAHHGRGEESLRMHGVGMSGINEGLCIHLAVHQNADHVTCHGLGENLDIKAFFLRDIGKIIGSGVNARLIRCRALEQAILLQNVKIFGKELFQLFK